VVHTLLEKKLVVTAGRKNVVGRPILYRTSRDFLVHFGLKDLSELPSLREFEEMARRALGSELLTPPEVVGSQPLAIGQEPTGNSASSTTAPPSTPVPAAETERNPATEPLQPTQDGVERALSTEDEGQRKPAPGAKRVL